MNFYAIILWLQRPPLKSAFHEDFIWDIPSKVIKTPVSKVSQMKQDQKKFFPFSAQTALRYSKISFYQGWAAQGWPFRYRIFTPDKNQVVVSIPFFECSEVVQETISPHRSGTSLLRPGNMSCVCFGAIFKEEISWYSLLGWGKCDRDEASQKQCLTFWEKLQHPANRTIRS